MSSLMAVEEPAKYSDPLADEAALWIRANKEIRVSQFPTKIVFNNRQAGNNSIKEEDDDYGKVQIDLGSSQQSD